MRLQQHNEYKFYVYNNNNNNTADTTPITTTTNTTTSQDQSDTTTNNTNLNLTLYVYDLVFSESFVFKVYKFFTCHQSHPSIDTSAKLIQQIQSFCICNLHSRQQQKVCFSTSLVASVLCIKQHTIYLLYYYIIIYHSPIKLNTQVKQLTHFLNNIESMHIYYCSTKY